ncbi:hypothetical protein QE152_g3894 [Popillia japonica]|uniref:Uncharacterized protein n=1 Tax=Popillia japonica TaxID=7064 RepID=A0AAW1N263_POPJA
MVFTLHSSLWWFAALSAILGVLRCTIHSYYCLVFCERYGPRFPTAFTLFMVVCAVVFLLTGFLTGLVKNYTGSDNMVLYLLTVMCGCCSVSWLIEIVHARTTNKSVHK